MERTYFKCLLLQCLPNNDEEKTGAAVKNARVSIIIDIKNKLNFQKPETKQIQNKIGINIIRHKRVSFSLYAIIICLIL
jgi:hypothetical protein